MYFGAVPYNLEGYIENFGDGSNMYRSDTFGQPRTLVAGDVLANGLELAGKPTDASNGGILLPFTDGINRRVAARIPLLFEGGTTGKLPNYLVVGDIFETGCVVLDTKGELVKDNPRYKDHAYEVGLVISGGLNGHQIEVPNDLIIALHDEIYPPSQKSLIGAFAIKRVLEMGARARRNLPNYGRLDSVPEPERLVGVFNEIATLRSKAQEERDTYHSTLAALNEQCIELRGVELLITGHLHGRGGVKVYDKDPQSLVEKLHIEVTSASVNSYEGYGGHLAQYLPFIEFQGRTIEEDEQVGAWLGVDKFGVTAEFVED